MVTLKVQIKVAFEDDKMFFFLFILHKKYVVTLKGFVAYHTIC